MQEVELNQTIYEPSKWQPTRLLQIKTREDKNLCAEWDKDHTRDRRMKRKDGMSGFNDRWSNLMGRWDRENASLWEKVDQRERKSNLFQWNTFREQAVLLFPVLLALYWQKQFRHCLLKWLSEYKTGKGKAAAALRHHIDKLLWKDSTNDCI